MRYIPIILGTLIIASCSQQNAKNDEDGSLLMFTGSYSQADSAGIKSFAFDQNTGRWSLLDSVAGISNPSFIAVDGVNNRIYAVGEDAGNSSTVNMLTYSQDGKNIVLEVSDTTGGGAPCHIVLSPKGDKVMTANYMGGSITVYDIDDKGRMTGSPSIIRFTGQSVDSARQSQPHLHQLTFSPDASVMYANDLGTDKIHVIPDPFNGDGMTDIDMFPGHGTRHTAFSPDGRYAYTLGEISGDIVVSEVKGKILKPVEVVKADTVGAEGSADIHISPDGRFLYASNRLKADGLAIFSVDSVSGRLTKAGYQLTGIHPRNFAITPNGRYLLVACRDTDDIEIYERDAFTGFLTMTGKIPVAKPSCIVFSVDK